MCDRVLDTFLDLVRIDSPTRSEAAVAAYCADVLAEAGCVVEFDDTASVTGSDTGNLIATLPGADSTRTLVLAAHMDCVEPCRGVNPVITDGVVTSSGETVLGADDKAGIAAIIEVVRRAAESRGARPTLRVVLTVAEENGLVGAKALDPAAVAGDLCLVLDADGQPGGIVVGAPSHYTFSATFHGKASHAGVAPEEGRSALVMASKAVCAMRLGRLDKHTTANIGTMAGGTATNVVAAQVTMTGECRSLYGDRVEQVKTSMDQAMKKAARDCGGTVEVLWTLEYEGFSMPEDAPVLKTVMAACHDIGLQPSTYRTGGGSDGNIFASYGVPTLVLACGLQGAHSTSERLAIGDLCALTDLVAAVVNRLRME